MKHNISQLKAKLMFNGFYEGLLMKKMRKKKIMKGDSIYRTINKISNEI
jgi:hypothetical protein